jgi:hypothetical protein
MKTKMTSVGFAAAALLARLSTTPDSLRAATRTLQVSASEPSAVKFFAFFLAKLRII